ncbi:MAG: hypothetical protein JSC189_000195 [Candidatus Tokpelaia sp. JSC189]|nr:MAG: hypothetical protein JSC189_000195 [Candidatus Tokpelaia sp. JSC189]
MPVVAFDTHEFIKTLAQSGMPEVQAEAISTAVRQAHKAADLVTRTDMREMEVRNNAKIEAVRTEIKDLRTDMREIETALRGEIKDLRKDMDSRFIQLEQRMTIKLGSMLVVAIGVFAAIVKLV